MNKFSDEHMRRPFGNNNRDYRFALDPGGYARFQKAIFSQPSQDVRVSPMFKSIDADEFISGIIAEHRIATGIEEFDEMEVTPTGPRSPLPPYSKYKEHVHNLLTHPIPWNPHLETLEKAATMVRRLFPGNLRSKSSLAAVKEMDLTTNSGTFYFTKRSQVVDEAIVWADKMYKGEYGMGTYILSTRFGKPDLPRLVFMADMRDNVLSARFVQPIIAQIKANPKLQAIFPALIDTTYVTSLITKRMLSPGNFISLDSSKHDMNVAKEYLALVNEFFRDLFSAEKDRRVWDVVQAINAFGTVLLPNDEWFVPEGRVLSGHTATNLLDSIIQLITMHYMCLRAGVKIPDFIMVNGDDAVMESEIPVDEIESIAYELGAIFNSSKQYSGSDGILFNSRIAYIDNQSDPLVSLPVRHRPLARAINNIVYPERDITNQQSKEFLSARSQSLRVVTALHTLEQHPNYLGVVVDVLRHDKLLKRLGPTKFIAEVTHPRVIDNYRSAAGLDKTGVTREMSLKGIQEWNIWKIIYNNIKD